MEDRALLFRGIQMAVLACLSKEAGSTFEDFLLEICGEEKLVLRKDL
jgi:hypothetical protein